MIDFELKIDIFEVIIGLKNEGERLKMIGIVLETLDVVYFQSYVTGL